MTDMKKPLIETVDLKKNFGSLQVLKGINQTIYQGEVVSIIGPSGGGKSTFLRCLNLLETPTSGKVIFEGQELDPKSTDLDTHRQKIGMVFQQFNVFPHLTVLNNITITPMLEKKVSKADAEKEARIRKAAGEAEAIRKVAAAKAEEIQMVYNAMMKAKPDDTLVQLKSLEALKDIANGEANKVFIPFEATNTLSSLGAVKEMFKDDKKAELLKDIMAFANAFRTQTAYILIGISSLF